MFSNYEKLNVFLSLFISFTQVNQVYFIVILDNDTFAYKLYIKMSVLTPVLNCVDNIIIYYVILNQVISYTIVYINTASLPASGIYGVYYITWFQKQQYFVNQYKYIPVI